MVARSVLVAGLVCWLTVSHSSAEVDPVEVRRLVRQLESREASQRDAAESRLRSLGTEALEFLPQINAQTSGVLKQRLILIRDHLEKLRVAESGKASRASLQGKMTLAAALEALHQQTGNEVIDYRRRFNQTSPETELELDLADIPFWEALDQLLDQAGLTTNNYVGEPNKLAIIARPESEIDRHGSGAYAGIFRIEPMEFYAQRNLRDPNISTLRLAMEVTWEPRVLPLQLRQDLSSVTITADNGETLELTRDGTIQIPVQPGVAAVTMRLPINLPSREVNQIASLKGKIGALVPGGDVTFEFNDLVGAKNVQQRKGGLTVVLERVRRNGSVQEFMVRLRLSQAGESMQSHLDWVENNEALLVSPAGKAEEPGGLEQYAESESDIGYKYLFPMDGDLDGYKFIYKTPAGIAEIPIEFELNNISLP